MVELCWLSDGPKNIFCSEFSVIAEKKKKKGNYEVICFSSKRNK